MEINEYGEPLAEVEARKQMVERNQERMTFTATKQDVLLPCPFCGKPGEVALDMSSDYERQWRWVAMCSECPADAGHYVTKEEALTVWNKRAQIDAAS